MNRSGSPWHFSNDKDQSKVFTVTKEQVERQLAAVTELRNINATYLETVEKAWIDHIIDTAVAVVVNPTYQEIYSPQPEKASRNPATLREKLTTRRLRSNSKEQAPPQEHLEVLLGSAKSLNSALSLLSCCYDRWTWVRSSKSSDVRFSPTTDDLQEFLNWKRQGIGHQKPPPSPETSLEEQQTVDTTPYEHVSEPPRLSIDISEDSETQLSILVETVEKWRYDAEAALDTTTGRYLGRNLNSLLRSGPSRAPSITPAISNATTVQMTRPGRPMVVSKPDFKLYPTECNNRRHTYELTKPTIDVSNFDPPYANFTVPRRPLSERHTFHVSEPSDSQTMISSSGITQLQSPPLQNSSHFPYVISLENSFDKESVPPGALQTPGLRPSLHPSNETIQDISIPLSDRQPVSDESQSESDEVHLQPKKSGDRTKSDLSSVSTTSVSGSSPHLTSDTTSSPKTKSSDGKIVSRSRGRMLLEQHEEREWRKPSLPVRPSMQSKSPNLSTSS